MEEYVIYRKSEFDRRTLRPEGDVRNLMELFTPFFEELKRLIETDEVRRLLNTSYRLDVPRQWEELRGLTMQR